MTEPYASDGERFVEVLKRFLVDDELPDEFEDWMRRTAKQFRSSLPDAVTDIFGPIPGLAHPPPSSTDVLAVAGTGVPANYEFSVTGRLQPDPFSGERDEWEEVEGESAAGGVTTPNTSTASCSPATSSRSAPSREGRRRRRTGPV